MHPKVNFLSILPVHAIYSFFSRDARIPILSLSTVVLTSELTSADLYPSFSHTPNGISLLALNPSHSSINTDRIHKCLLGGLKNVGDHSL